MTDHPHAKLLEEPSAHPPSDERAALIADLRRALEAARSARDTMMRFPENGSAHMRLSDAFVDIDKGINRLAAALEATSATAGGGDIMDGAKEAGLRILLQLALDEMRNVIEAVDHQHETRPGYLKYGTPYGAINGLAKVREDILVQCAMWGIDVSPKRPSPSGETDEAAFEALRAANEARQKMWANGESVSLLFRATELGGKCGEVLNVCKKIERERQGWRGSRATVQDLADELADVVICANLLAMTEGIDLDAAVIHAAVIRKFNATSEERLSP